MYKTGNSLRGCPAVKAQKVVFSLCLVVIGFLAVIPVFPGAPPETLAQRVDAILSKPWLRRVAFSACLVRRQTGEIVYEKNSHLSLPPT
jgi:D-alanyl-D-alanine carboxypeptidase